MNISSQTKLLLLIAAILIFILFFSNFFNQGPIQNEGNLVIDNQANYNNEYNYLDNSSYNEIPKNDLILSSENDDTVNQEMDDTYNCTSNNCEEEIYRKKLRGKNKAKNGQYKKSNYIDGERGNGPSEFDKFFDKNNEMIKDVYTNNDDFSPNDETGGALAAYKPGKKIKMTDDEMFNAQNLLPKVENKDWFEVPEEPISVKNRHLININRPIGINTIGTTNKNPSYDIRGTIPNPKFVVSPFLNSSIEPDINNRGLSC